MAAIIGLCAVGMHMVTIWNGAKKVRSVLFPLNQVTGISEIPLYNAAQQVVAMQLELHTQNGWIYCFCFDIHDQALRYAIRQEFPVGTNISRGVCNEARTKLIATNINHRIYFDPSHGKRIFILMSPRPINLNVFKKPHWTVM